MDMVNRRVVIELQDRDRVWPCLICKEWFPSEALLKSHMLNNHPKPQTAGPRMDEQKSVLEAQVETRGLSCKYCNARFAEDRHLNVHILTVHEVPVKLQMLSCEYCNARFAENRHLNVHILTVHEERECGWCQLTFDGELNLESHVIEVHKRCPQCNEKFAKSLEVEKHMEREHGRKDLLGPTHQDGPETSGSEDLLDHRLHLCDWCPLIFYGTTNLERHMISVHKRCPLCNEQFARTCAVERHMTNEHGCANFQEQTHQENPVTSDSGEDSARNSVSVYDFVDEGYSDTEGSLKTAGSSAGNGTPRKEEVRVVLKRGNEEGSPSGGMLSLPKCARKMDMTCVDEEAERNAWACDDQSASFSADEDMETCSVMGYADPAEDHALDCFNVSDGEDETTDDEETEDEENLQYKSCLDSDVALDERTSQMRRPEVKHRKRLYFTPPPMTFAERGEHALQEGLADKQCIKLPSTFDDTGDMHTYSSIADFYEKDTSLFSVVSDSDESDKKGNGDITFEDNLALHETSFSPTIFDGSDDDGIGFTEAVQENGDTRCTVAACSRDELAGCRLNVFADYTRKRAGLYASTTTESKGVSPSVTSNNDETANFYLCKCCGARYTCERLLNAHELEHENEHVGAHCSTVCGQENDLGAHALTPSMRLSHSCSQCSMTFAERVDHELHTLTHEVDVSAFDRLESPIEWTASLVSKESVQDVSEAPEQEECLDYMCLTCFIVFSKKSDLDIHMEKFHQQKLMSCPFCFEKFSFSDLAKHIDVEHSEYDANSASDFTTSSQDGAQESEMQGGSGFPDAHDPGALHPGSSPKLTAALEIPDEDFSSTGSAPTSNLLACEVKQGKTGSGCQEDSEAHKLDPGLEGEEKAVHGAVLASCSCSHEATVQSAHVIHRREDLIKVVFSAEDAVTDNADEGMVVQKCDTPVRTESSSLRQEELGACNGTVRVENVLGANDTPDPTARKEGEGEKGSLNAAPNGSRRDSGRGRSARRDLGSPAWRDLRSSTRRDPRSSSKRDLERSAKAANLQKGS